VVQVALVQEVLQPQALQLGRQGHQAKVTLAAAVQAMAVQTMLVVVAVVLAQLAVVQLLALLQVMAEQAHQTALRGLR
jgi:hypothetical protein